jgi:hypothetical protein
MATRPTKLGPRRLGALLAGAFIVLYTHLAAADETTYKETQTGGDQSVFFKDDPLAAGGLSPYEALLRVSPSPKRVMLLRPRTQFVPELLKSVENL